MACLLMQYCEIMLDIHENNRMDDFIFHDQPSLETYLMGK